MSHSKFQIRISTSRPKFKNPAASPPAILCEFLSKFVQNEVVLHKFSLASRGLPENFVQIFLQLLTIIMWLRRRSLLLILLRCVVLLLLIRRQWRRLHRVRRLDAYSRNLLILRRCCYLWRHRPNRGRLCLMRSLFFLLILNVFLRSIWSWWRLSFGMRCMISATVSISIATSGSVVIADLRIILAL